VTYFKTVSFTFPEGNENFREVGQVDTNSSKTRLEKGNTQEEERKASNVEYCTSYSTGRTL
jgi:hypothetical protein